MTNNAWNTPYPDANGEILIGNTAGRPSAANITGDASISITNGAGSITIDNAAAGGGDLVKISSAVASDDATIDFTDLSSTYFLYIVVLNDITPDTDAVTFRWRTSIDNGSTWDDDSSDYKWNWYYLYPVDSVAASASAVDNDIPIFGPAGTAYELGSSANEKLSGVVYVFNPSASKYTYMISRGYYYDEETLPVYQECGGFRTTTSPVDGIRFIMDTGLIESGTITLYGALSS